MPHRMRFAPSTTGFAHPGTLLSALLTWLDAKQKDATYVLRLDNLDPERSTPKYERSMIEALAWLGLDWQSVIRESERLESYENALESLIHKGLVYACNCTRSQLKKKSAPSVTGGFVYPNTCRKNIVTRNEWRNIQKPLRLELPTERIELHDESGLDLSQTLAQSIGDPVVRRRDGAFTYLFANAVDDATLNITHIVRGRDLAPTTATQVAIMHLLDASIPTYRHHFLFLETPENKLSKLHRSLPYPELKQQINAPNLIGLLAQYSEIKSNFKTSHPSELLSYFNWQTISKHDLIFQLKSISTEV